MVAQMSLSVKCPYCLGEEFEIDAPVAEKSSPDIICLPYTRDIGRFDPKKGEMHGYWSEIGRDFFSEVLGYERIGILRWFPGIRVFYRVCRCPSCHHLFDVYANCTPGLTLDKIWPHLFAPSDIRNVVVGDFIKNLRRSMLVTSTFLIFSFVPRFMEATDFYSFVSQNWGVVFVRVLGFFVYIAVNLLLSRMIEMISCDTRFERLFQIRDCNGLNYWRNYTVCRFIGVHQVGSTGFSHVSIIAGYSSVFVLFLIFLSQLVAEYHRMGDFVFFEIFWFVVIGFLVGSVVQNLRREKITKQRLCNCSISSLVKVFFPIRKYGVFGFILGLGVWTFFIAFPLIGQRTLLNNVDDIFALIFWSILAYSLGVGTWGIMETVLYILRGVRRIPMHIDPHDGYESLAVLDGFALKSSMGMSILFFFVILITSIPVFVPYDPQIAWIVAWVQIGLFGLHLAIALALGGLARVFLFLLTLIFFIILMVIGLLEGRVDLYSNLNISLIGFMLVAVFFFHTRESIGHLRALREKSREVWISYYEDEIKNIENQIIERFVNPKTREGINIHEFIALVQSLETLLSLRRTVVEAPVSPLANVYQRTAAIFGLLVASIAPALVEAILTRLAP